MNLQKERATFVAPLLFLLRSGRTKNRTPIGYPKGVSYSSLESHITCIKISFHLSFDRRTIEKLKAVRRVSFDKVCVGLRLEVVYNRSFRKHTHRFSRVKVVVRSSGT